MSNKQNDQFRREAIALFRDHYLSCSDKNPEAGERYINCLELLSTGTTEDLIKAWERHFHEDSWIRKEAEAMLAELGPEASFADGMAWLNNRNTPAA
jgi:hypothetical protein